MLKSSLEVESESGTPFRNYRVRIRPNSEQMRGEEEAAR